MRIVQHVRRLKGYVPGEQPKCRRVVKLNTNENPYPPSPQCAEALTAFDLEFLRRYPDPDCTALKSALARLNHTTPEHIFVGNGSDEILALAAKTFVENDEAIGSLNPSYSLYQTLAAIRDVEWLGGDPRKTALPKRLALFLWTNPNAPTGEFVEPKEIAAFARSFPGIVIVDEAYADFARANAMAFATARTNRNLLVMRTFSKSFSLAGLRVGYCVGPTDLIDALVKVKDSYNVDALAQRVALAAVKDVKYMRANVKKVVADRKRLTAELEARGWNVLPSESNFIFAAPPARSVAAQHREAKRIFLALKRENIFVRYFPGPLTGSRLRITIGTPAQNEALLAALDRKVPVK